MTTAMSAAAPTTTWNIDSVHSSAQFKVKHLMISNVKGEFAGIAGFLELGDNITDSKIEATIDAATIDTRDEKRDAHLRSGDFFDTEKFPTLFFKSGRISRRADGELIVAGDLTLHGVTKPVTFAVEGPSAPTKDPWGGTRIGLTAIGTIDRREFGLIWNSLLEGGGLVIGEDVHITLEVEFIRA